MEVEIRDVNPERPIGKKKAEKAGKSREKEKAKNCFRWPSNSFYFEPSSERQTETKDAIEDNELKKMQDLHERKISDLQVLQFKNYS